MSCYRLFLRIGDTKGEEGHTLYNPKNDLQPSIEPYAKMKCFDCYSILTNQCSSIINKQVYLQENNTKLYMYSCYYCNSYQTDLEKNYERHVILTHPKRPAYPSKVDLDRLGIHGQGKKWEIHSIYLLQQTK